MIHTNPNTTRRLQPSPWRQQAAVGQRRGWSIVVSRRERRCTDRRHSSNGWCSRPLSRSCRNGCPSVWGDSWHTRGTWSWTLQRQRVNTVMLTICTVCNTKKANGCPKKMRHMVVSYAYGILYLNRHHAIFVKIKLHNGTIVLLNVIWEEYMGRETTLLANMWDSKTR